MLLLCQSVPVDTFGRDYLCVSCVCRDVYIPECVDMYVHWFCACFRVCVCM